MNNDDPKRIEELEKRIQALESLIGELTKSGAVKPAPTAWQPRALPREPVAAPTPMVSAPSQLLAGNEAPRLDYAPKRDWEALIGRYGTLALATVSVLAAVGTFIGWAISKGWLGPTPRVGLGLVTAAALAAAGLRLRRTERSFGSSLLGLSLAVVHVCAWGAGPSLHLVPTGVAFGLASLASAAIALLARIEEDQPLWCVGFAGAAIAPFVTSTGEGSLPMLAAYGASVLAASGRALGPREWKVAGRLFGLAATLYVGALMLGTELDHGPLLALALPLAVALVGVMPWVSGVLRRDRLRPLGALAALAAIRAAIGGDLSDAGTEWMRHAWAIAAAGIAWLGLVDISAVMPARTEADNTPRTEGDWVDAGLVPVTFGIAILLAVPPNPATYALCLAGSAVVLLATVARHYVGTLRDAAAAATAVAALGAATQFMDGSTLKTTASIAVLGAAFFAANRWRQTRSWEGIGSLALGWSMLVTLGLLNERTPYFYSPFGTAESAVSAVVLAAAYVSWRLIGEEQPPKLLQGGTIVWAFAWIHQEIAFAINPTVATLMRVSYYALTSVASVWTGRSRAVALLRHVGLGLAVVAAGTALYSARHLASIGARILADLVAAGFLLAIAYWYRKPGSAKQPALTPEPSNTTS